RPARRRRLRTGRALHGVGCDCWLGWSCGPRLQMLFPAFLDHDHADFVELFAVILDAFAVMVAAVLVDLINPCVLDQLLERAAFCDKPVTSERSIVIAKPGVLVDVESLGLGHAPTRSSACGSCGR